jgi:hypothetical protein
MPTTMIKAKPSRARHPQDNTTARLIAAVREFFTELTRSYRPERHYMRGGGTGGVA